MIVGIARNNRNVQSTVISAMRMSLWLPIIGSAALATFWLGLCAAMGFQVWLDETIWEGRLLQAALISYPLLVACGFWRSAGRPKMVLCVFIASWTIGLPAILFVGLGGSQADQSRLSD
ncbi:MAG: hypothetical protein ABIT04_04655 [Novosphingobium sp.]